MRNRLPAILVAAFGVTALLVFVFSDLIVAAGRYIPQQNMLLDYVLGGIWAMILGLSIVLWPAPAKDKKYLLWGWLAKCVMTLGFMLLYEYHYELDSFGYWWGSTHPWWDWDGLRLGSGSINIRQLTYLHAQVFPNSFHWLKVSFSMVGYLGIYLCYRAAVRLLGRDDIRIFLALVLYPSILFWSSTLGKDPIVLFGIAVYLYGVSSWYATGKAPYLLLSLLGIWETMFFRIWMGPILLAPMGVFLFARIRGNISRVFLIAIVAVAFFFAAGRFSTQFNIESSQDLITSIDANAHNSGWQGGSGEEIQAGFSSPAKVIAFLPYGAFTALFRPLPGEVLNPFGILAGLENLVLLWLLARAIRRSRVRELFDPRLMWTISLILTWSSVYGFISVQNLGAAVRFRLQILPVLLLVLLYLSRNRSTSEPKVPSVSQVPRLV
jgi:hypothetical protein